MERAVSRHEALIVAALSDFGLFERIIEAIYTARVRPRDIVVDGGAHTGLHTLPLARIVGRRGRVLAVEPVPENVATLKARLRHERLSAEVIAVALGAASGSADFTVVRNATTRSGLREVAYPFPVDLETISVKVVTLDDLLAGCSSWRFAKLDLEGGEYHALMGARESLRRWRPMLVFECSLLSPGQYGYTLAEFFALFDAVGYRVLDLFGEPVTEQGWTRRRPWYAIGVAAGSDDERFVAEQLPALLERFTPRIDP